MLVRPGLWLCAAVSTVVIATPAWSQPAPPASPPDQTTDQSADQAPLDVDVIAKRLDIARSQIQPSLGATTTTFTPEALATIPQGQNAPLNQVLLQAPGVAQDSFGQLHVRGDHANLQYRIDGVQLPEGVSFFGQALATRYADSISLITGALPAQYGFRQAGVIDIRLPNGYTDPGTEVSLYGGTRNWFEPSATTAGHAGTWDWFLTGEWLQNQIGIENPTDSFNAVHDKYTQYYGLGKITDTLDADTRISLIAGAARGNFQIPNSPGQTPNFTVNGISSFDSAELDEHQREITDFGILSLQKHIGSVDVQVSAFTRYSDLYYTPDPLGDLIFLGNAQTAERYDLATGTQTDASWKINEFHTLRSGFLVQGERGGATTVSQVLPVNPTGAQTSDVPLTIFDGSGKTGMLYGVYVQDEWKVLPLVTINYGLRFDDVDAYDKEYQASPRVNLVWQATQTTTAHIGYARYFTPPPFELVGPTTVNAFNGTSAASAVTQDSTVKAESAHYFDAGVSQRLLPGLTVGVDAYYKLAHNLIDEGQFGAPIILSAFNYADGNVHGAELTASYDQGPWSLYGNLAYSHAMGKDIVSAQFNFSPEELAYISQHWIFLDHDQRWSGSAGAAYTLNRGTAFPARLSTDLVVGSGLRASTATVPNGAELPAYYVVNLSAVQKLPHGIELRLDVLNLLDKVYEIRNGTGVGVGAPQFGLRRTILAGVTERF